MDALANMEHSPEAGRAALRVVHEAVGHLRPDIAATVLAQALAMQVSRVPPERRQQFGRTCETVVQTAVFKSVMG